MLHRVQEFVQSREGMDFDIERLGRRKRSGSDPHIDMDMPRVRLPPWYVRLFLYSMMCLCFAMVLFWQPGHPRDHPRYSAVYEEDSHQTYDEDIAEAADLHNNQPPKEEERIKAKLIDVSKASEAPNVKCEAVEGLESAFSVCGEKIQGPPKDQLQRVQKILKDNPALGIVDIGPWEGSFAMMAGKMGRKVVLVEPFSENIPGLLKGLATNALVPNGPVLINNALSDNFGDSAISDALRGKHAAVNAIRFSEVLANTPLSAFFLRVRMQGFECFALGADGIDILGSRSIPAILTDGLRNGNNKASCLSRTLATLKQFGLKPSLADGTAVDVAKLEKGEWNVDALFWTK